MSITFSQHNNEIIVNNNKIVFEHRIRYVKEVENSLIVLLGIPNNVRYLNNVFGVSEKGEIKWRIQSPSDGYSVKNQLPYENLFVNGTEVVVSDFYGRRFSVNLTSGEILTRDIAK